jgi:hypothetical protein
LTDKLKGFFEFSLGNKGGVALDVGACRAGNSAGRFHHIEGNVLAARNNAATSRLSAFLPVYGDDAVLLPLGYGLGGTYRSADRLGAMVAG